MTTRVTDGRAPARAAGEPRPVLPARRRQRARRRHDRPGTHRPAAAGRAKSSGSPRSPPRSPSSSPSASVKAATNFFAGTLSDRYGRKPVLVAGWIIGLPVPLLLMWAPSWGWVVFANVLLGVNQGLTWSTTVIMKIDLVGPARRGFAMGLNEAAGYGAVALTALATGFIAAAVRAATRTVLPRPRLRRARTRPVDPVRARDPRPRPPRGGHTTPTERRHEVGLSTRQVFTLTTFRDRALSSCRQAGLVNNLNDGLAWGLFPIYFADAGLSVGRIGVLAALYPAVWGLGQLVTGGLSDRIGRKPLIVGGMLTQAAAIAWIAATTGFAAWAVGAARARRRHRHGLPDPARRHRRRRPPHLAGPLGRRLPAVARRRLRRRRPPRRHPRRPALHHRRHLGRRRAHRRSPGSSSPSACTRPTAQPRDCRARRPLEGAGPGRRVGDRCTG